MLPARLDRVSLTHLFLAASPSATPPTAIGPPGPKLNAPKALPRGAAQSPNPAKITATYGTNAQITMTTKRMLRMGNVTGDKFIKYICSGNDRDPILVAVGSTSPNNVISGYRIEDTNLNGQVKYTGGGNDRDPILVAVGSTVPTSVVVEQVP